MEPTMNTIAFLILELLFIEPEGLDGVTLHGALNTIIGQISDAGRDALGVNFPVNDSTYRTARKRLEEKGWVKRKGRSQQDKRVGYYKLTAEGMKNAEIVFGPVSS